MFHRQHGVILRSNIRLMFIVALKYSIFYDMLRNIFYIIGQTEQNRLVPEIDSAGNILGMVPKYDSGTQFEVPITREHVEMLVQKTPLIYGHSDNNFNVSNTNRYFEVNNFFPNTYIMVSFIYMYMCS